MTLLKIDIENGILEVDGEEQFVEKIYNDFKSTLSSQATNKQKEKQVRKEEVNKQDSFRDPNDDDLISFGDLAECLEMLGEKKITDVDIVLIASSYYQEKQGLASFPSQAINSELKNLGKAPTNITRALQSSIDTKPQLIMQVKKTGKTKQGKKLYKVTKEGLKKAKKLVFEIGE